MRVSCEWCQLREMYRIKSLDDGGVSYADLVCLKDVVFSAGRADGERVSPSKHRQRNTVITPFDSSETHGKQARKAMLSVRYGLKDGIVTKRGEIRAQTH